MCVLGLEDNIGTNITSDFFKKNNASPSISVGSIILWIIIWVFLLLFNAKERYYFTSKARYYFGYSMIFARTNVGHMHIINIKKQKKYHKKSAQSGSPYMDAPSRVRSKPSCLVSQSLTYSIYET